MFQYSSSSPETVFSNKIKNINPTNAKMVIEINGDKYDSKHYSNYFNDSLYNINSKFNSSYIANSTTSYICKLPKALKQGDNKIEVYLKDDVVDYVYENYMYIGLSYEDVSDLEYRTIYVEL